MDMSREQSSSTPTSTANSTSTATSITATATSTEDSPVSSGSGSDDPFDQDDSFLVQCSQAIEEKEFQRKPQQPQQPSVDSNSNHHQFKVPRPTVVTKTVDAPASTHASGDASVFDDDDAEEFESLLSQIEIPETVASSGAKPSKNIHSERKISATWSLSSKSTTAVSSGQSKPNSSVETRSMTSMTNRATSRALQVPKPVLPLRDGPSSNASPNLVSNFCRDVAPSPWAVVNE